MEWVTISLNDGEKFVCSAKDGHHPPGQKRRNGRKGRNGRIERNGRKGQNGRIGWNGNKGMNGFWTNVPIERLDLHKYQLAWPQPQLAAQLQPSLNCQLGPRLLLYSFCVCVSQCLS